VFSRIYQILGIVALTGLAHSAQAEELTIKKGQFYLGSNLIPPGCIVQLTPQLNGDDTTASVFLDRPSFRGCLQANESFPPQEDGAASPTYTIEANLEGYNYLVTGCSYSSEGTLRKSCSNIRIRFEERDYHSVNAAKKVMVVSKTGDWEPVLWPENDRSFDSQARILHIRERYRAVAGNQRLKTKTIKKKCVLPDDFIAVTYRFQNNEISEIVEQYVEDPELRSTSFYYEQGELIFAYLDMADPVTHEQHRLYFQNEKAFLCKVTHLGAAPEGFAVDVPTEVPCSTSLVLRTIDHSNDLLNLYQTKDLYSHARWCQ